MTFVLAIGRAPDLTCIGRHSVEVAGERNLDGNAILAMHTVSKS